MALDPAVSPEVAELRKDAERYRWLRQFTVGFLECPDNLPFGMWHGPTDKLDAAIDAAQNAEQE